MPNRNPIKNFEAFWKTFNHRYPFFKLRNVDWNAQYAKFRSLVTDQTSDEELFDILCQMVDPLDDGHVEIEARLGKQRKLKVFTAEKKTRFNSEFDDNAVKQLFDVTGATLVRHGFRKPKATKAWMLHYAKSSNIGYLRILELEDVKKKKLKNALDKVSADFDQFNGVIIDIRDCPGGEDDIAIRIINRFSDKKRVAFHRKTKKGPGEHDYKPLRTWNLTPQGDTQFTGPIVLLTNDSVFSGGEAFALAIRELPYVTIVGDRTNGIFSYTLDKELPNGWEYCLSYQVYFSADMVCFEGKGIPVDVEVHNSRKDIEAGVDPMIETALSILDRKTS